MCKVLGIPRSEYYYQINKKKNSYEEANEKLDKEIKEEYKNQKEDMVHQKSRRYQKKGESRQVKKEQQEE